MRFEVLLTEDAYRDSEDIYTYVADHDSPGKADALLIRVEEVIETLTEVPFLTPFSGDRFQLARARSQSQFMCDCCC
jgi:plasmid stabilization system protein ParE